VIGYIYFNKSVFGFKEGSPDYDDPKAYPRSITGAFGTTPSSS
jgi:hypothetical protein